MSLRRGLEMRVMNRDNPNDNTLAFPVLSIFRGLYQRVAAKLGVDPSYVSRVARGERQSAAVLAALQAEMDVIRQHLNQQNAQFPNGKAKDSDLQNGKLQNGQASDGPLHDAKVPNASRDGQRPAGKGNSGARTRRSSTGGAEAKAAD
jgi:transcriptional regulator with XRE-family HTH domain